MKFIHKNHGFTLIELMIVVAIIGILSAIAYPSYQEYVVRGRIPDATSQLANKRAQMEQFFLNNRKYLASATTNPTTNACASDTETSKYFTFVCPAATLTDNTFVLTATGKDSMSGFTFTINQSGEKDTPTVPSGWSKPPNGDCWVSKKDGSC